jgi:6-pyruvoyltetrahydropterin/6-carboxytetrahydropterin synthase
MSGDWEGLAMTASRSVRVERNRLRFAAAHMATFGGDCEPLHGHNYDVLVEVEGDLTDESWVIDFGLIKRLARELCEQLDHRFLLQRDSLLLTSEERDGSWQVRFGDDRCYQFPAQDVLPLPIDNSTAERLAQWIHTGIAAGLRDLSLTNIRRLSVGVEEMPGQTGWYEAAV